MKVSVFDSDFILCVHSHAYLKLIIYKSSRTIQVDGSSSHIKPQPSHTTAMPEFSRGPRPSPLDNSQLSPHPSPHEAARVVKTITEISDASAEIIRRDEVYPIA